MFGEDLQEEECAEYCSADYCSSDKEREDDVDSAYQYSTRITAGDHGVREFECGQSRTRYPDFNGF